jgi:thiosulfate/3-mercaptopyruvate sulfurtransferase
VTNKMTTGHSLASFNIAIAETLLDTPNSNRLFVDCRLGEADEELDDFRKCHIHGAVHAQIRDVFSGPQTETSGNLPLPKLEALQDILREWGANQDTEIVTYGRSLALAARGWWILKWAGLSNVRVLDGGLNAWVNAGGPVAQGDTPIRRVPRTDNCELSGSNMPSIEVKEVERLSDATMIIDARDEASYLAGCIPQAVNLPAIEQWTPKGKFRTKTEISELYSTVDLTHDSDVVVYCGGGVLSALEILTLSSLGISARLFVGSWSEWNKSSDRMARSSDFARQIIAKELHNSQERA